MFVKYFGLTEDQPPMRSDILITFRFPNPGTMKVSSFEAYHPRNDKSIRIYLFYMGQTMRPLPIVLF